jgi:predicted nucleic acid-binding protein
MISTIDGLLLYELANTTWQAKRRGRIGATQADEIFQSMAGLQIEILPLDWAEVMPLARRFARSAFDAAYLSLAEKIGETIITGDESLFNAVKARPDWVQWVEEYRD